MKLPNERLKEIFLVFLLDELERLPKENLFGFSNDKQKGHLATRNKIEKNKRTTRVRNTYSPKLRLLA